MTPAFIFSTLLNNELIADLEVSFESHETIEKKHAACAKRRVEAPPIAMLGVAFDKPASPNIYSH
jgi:hypothetical protein